MRRPDNDVDSRRGRHRRPLYEGRHNRPARWRGEKDASTPKVLTLRSARRPLMVALLMSIGLVVLPVSTGSAAPSQARASMASSALARGSLDRLRLPASRSNTRSRTVLPTPAPSPPTAPSAAPAANPSTPATSAVPAEPTPVGGLTQIQMDHAATIVKVGLALHMGRPGCVIAVATALQETRLLNLANWSVPESANLPNDGFGVDHDSIGLFQQRPSAGWGTVAELMDPATAATRFYQVLGQISGWWGMAVTDAAQAVQQSAYPDAYAQQEWLANLIVAALA